MTENEYIWSRLKAFNFLTASQNQSIIENRLPFGMKRHLTPLKIPENLPILKPSDFVVNLKDPNSRLFMRSIEPKIENNNNFGNKFKFIQHKIISNCSSCVMVKESESEAKRKIKFDPTAILFFQPTVAKTNLTSNANGTVSNDKNQLAAILQRSCWLISYSDLIKNDELNLPRIQNNKLRSLKYAEFISEEWKELKGFGEVVEFIGITKNARDSSSDSCDYEVIKSKKCLKDLNLFIIGKDGNIKFTTRTTTKSSNLILFDSIYRIKVNLESGDTIFIFNGDFDFEKFIMKVKSFDLTEDFEGKAIELLLKSEQSAVLISKVKFTDEFDELFKQKDTFIKYVSHLDTKMGMVVNNPIPGSFGCTTRHSVIYRSGYFAALHHDASKINRFPDTINYIIRKMGNPVNIGKRMEQEGEESILKRISDVQYFAYLLIKKDKIYLALGGGAKCVILSKDLKTITVHEIPILMEFPDLNCHDQVILLSPHFPPSILIKSVQAPTIQEWIKRLLQLSEVDLSNFKVSLAHFELKM